MSNRRMTFGMYKGREINDVIVENPKYIEWCIHFVSFFHLPKKSRLYCQKKCNHTFLKETLMTRNITKGKKSLTMFLMIFIKNSYYD